MLNLRQSVLATSFAFGVALIAGAAQAGTITEYSQTWKPGFYNTDSGPAAYERTVHVDYDTSYKTGSARITRTIQLNSYQEGAELTENGYELVVTEFDPSQVETAAGQMDDRPLISNIAKPNYFLDDSDNKYHLVK
ncbi:hypothetical protein [Terasakiella sp.]|uniref:hypothetical protein n=1 Tax=Terasakiella sp. TaxID=2034861 RepID=UPI003AA94722